MIIQEICQEFYFYPNGEYKTKSQWSSQLYTFDNDVSELSNRIRIYGTENQIDKAFDDYQEITNLNLDECFNFKIEKKGSHFYNEKDNIIIKDRLKYYKEIYDKNNKQKAIVINIK